MLVRGMHVKMPPFMRRTKTVHKNLVKILSTVKNSKCTLTPTNLKSLLLDVCSHRGIIIICMQNPGIDERGQGPTVIRIYLGDATETL